MFGFFANRKGLVLNSPEIKGYNDSRNKADTGELCHAPFKSMLFTPSGQIMTCHYNRGYEIGRYPDETLMDIWRGHKADSLRKSLRKNDLSLGCHQCYNDLSHQRYFSAGCYKYDNLPVNQNKFPVLMEFQLSNLCNLECVMCSGEYSSGIRTNREKKLPYHMPWDDDFVIQLNDFIPHLKKAYFTGGEPLIIPVYRKIWENISAINPSLEMNISTNGSFLDGDIKAILQKGCFHITLSIDSLNPENYENIRINASFDTTQKNIAYLQQYAHEHNRLFSVKCVLFKQNINDIPDLFAYFNERGVQIYPKPVWMPFKHALFNSSPDELAAYINILRNTSMLAESPIQEQNVARLKEIIAQLVHWHSNTLKQKCPDFRNMAMVDLQKHLKQKINKEIALQKAPSEDKKLFKALADKSLQMLAACELPDASLKRAYSSFLSIPTAFVLFEILRGNDEKLLARFEEEGRD